jgi:hypothetical protein
MRTGFLVICIVAFLMGSISLQAQEIAVNDPLYKHITNNIFYPLFTALKNGDVNTIKQYISGDMYSKNKILLEENKEYPAFLRNFYRGAKFQVENVEQIDANLIVNVVIEFPNGDRSRTKLLLQTAKGSLIESGAENLKVVKEIRDNRQLLSDDRPPVRLR